MRKKERVREYAERHPASTVREIQKALGISSPSVVHYHLKVSSKADKVKVLRAALKTCMTQLAHCVGPETEAGRVAKRALDATK
jgi:predicted transcriptional regulator